MLCCVRPVLPPYSFFRRFVQRFAGVHSVPFLVSLFGLLYFPPFSLRPIRPLQSPPSSHHLALSLVHIAHMLCSSRSISMKQRVDEWLLTHQTPQILLLPVCPTPGTISNLQSCRRASSVLAAPNSSMRTLDNCKNVENNSFDCK